MAWSNTATISPLKTEWQYTDPIEGEYFRLKHSEAPNDGVYAVAQVVFLDDGTVQFIDSQVLSYERKIVDTLRLKKPGWATERRLAFKKFPRQPKLEEELRRLLLPGFLQQQPVDPFNFVRKSEWKIDVEVSDYEESAINYNAEFTSIQTQLNEISTQIATLKTSSSSSPSTTPSSTQLNYISDGDDRGVFYYLGSNKRTSDWSNPHTSEAITISTSTLLPGRNVSCTVDRAPSGDFVTQSASNQWLAVDLKSIALKCNYYSMRGWNNTSNHPRNWKLQGSLDSSLWEDLDTQSNNTTIQQSTWLSLPVTSSKAYRYFRILQIGNDSSGQEYLALGEWELYGEIN